MKLNFIVIHFANLLMLPMRMASHHKDMAREHQNEKDSEGSAGANAHRG